MRSLLWKDFDLLSENEYDSYVSIIDDNVFEDSKLRRVLETVYENYSDSDEIIETLKKIPDRNSLLYRQEIFEDILNDDGVILDIYYKLARMASRYEALQSANENIKKRLFLVMYIYNLNLFLNEVKEKITDTKYKSIGIKNILNDISIYIERKESLFNRAKKLYNKLISMFDINVTYLNGAPYVQLDYDKKNNLEDDMLDIAQSLDIKLEKSARIMGRKEINPYFLFELVKNDEKLKEELVLFYEENKDEAMNLSYISAELKFYIQMKHLFNVVTSKGVCYTKVELSNDINKQTEINDIYDISLTLSNIEAIPNDFKIDDNENIQFILGVNSGGKTCYIRALCINYVIYSSCGFMFAKKALVYPVKYINTHFPNEENYRIGDGRLIDELKRLDIIKKTFGSDSITFLNETFSSTSEDKACELTMKLIDESLKTNAKILFVTHQYKIFDDIHEKRIGFYTPVVIEGENNIRTHKIKKVDKKLLSYVGDILVKHGLTKELLLKRKNK